MRKNSIRMRCGVTHPLNCGSSHCLRDLVWFLESNPSLAFPSAMDQRPSMPLRFHFMRRLKLTSKSAASHSLRRFRVFLSIQ